MAGGPIYGEGYLDLHPQLSSGFAGTLTGLLGPMGAKLGELLKSPIALGIGAGLTAGIAAVNLGGSFDEAFDQIRIGTGATGEALEGLKDDFREVFGSVPVDMDLASAAVADLNTRLGLTGEPLQDLAVQFLNLSRITGTDLSANIAGVTRVFGDWGVATEDQAGALDSLFRASQATGASVDGISASLVQYGAPLRQLGFDFETSAALIAKFEKEGVNAELVLGSLRIALGKMARDGEDAESTFRRVTEEIANAGSASEANALALELFGARAGPDMAAAIREGRFELGELLDQVSGGTETINGAAADTDDWRQSLTLLGNNLKLFLEPIATGVFNALGAVMGWLVGVVETVKAALADPDSGLGKAFRTVGEVFEQVGAVIGGVIEVVQVWWDLFGERILRVTTEVFGALLGVVKPVLDGIRAVIEVVLGLITGDWTRAWQGVKDFLSSIWETLKAIVEVPLRAISAVVEEVLGVIGAAWDRVWGALAGAARTFLDAVVAAIKYPINAILGLLESLINAALRGLQAAIDTADVLAGPFINFPDEVFSPVRIPRVHSGGIADDEMLAVLQAGEVVTPRDTARRLFQFLDNLGETPAPTTAGGLFDGASFTFAGTPEAMVEAVARRVGLEVRLAT